MKQFCSLVWLATLTDYKKDFFKYLNVQNNQMKEKTSSHTALVCGKVKDKIFSLEMVNMHIENSNIKWTRREIILRFKLNQFQYFHGEFS